MEFVFVALAHFQLYFLFPIPKLGVVGHLGYGPGGNGSVTVWSPVVELTGYKNASVRSVGVQKPEGNRDRLAVEVGNTADAEKEREEG